MITKNIIKNMILGCGTGILRQENTPQKNIRNFENNLYIACVYYKNVVYLHC